MSSCNLLILTNTKYSKQNYRKQNGIKKAEKEECLQSRGGDENTFLLNSDTCY